jgi:hypothetical protein
MLHSIFLEYPALITPQLKNFEQYLGPLCQIYCEDSPNLSTDLLFSQWYGKYVQLHFFNSCSVQSFHQFDRSDCGLLPHSRSILSLSLECRMQGLLMVDTLASENQL